MVTDRFCKQPLANTGADDENSPPAHGVFKPKRENMLINYCENLPFKSDFIFARARNLKREIDTNFALNIAPHGFYGTFLTIAHERRRNEHKISSDVIKIRLSHLQDEGAKGVIITHKFKITRHFNAVVE